MIPRRQIFHDSIVSVVLAPISSRFLSPLPPDRPPILLSAPNQNRHATQAILRGDLSTKKQNQIQKNDQKASESCQNFNTCISSVGYWSSLFSSTTVKSTGFEISLSFFWFSQVYINFTFILRQLKGNHNNIKPTTKTVACSRLQDSVHAHLIFAWLVLFLAASLLSKSLAQATRSANSYKPF